MTAEKTAVEEDLNPSLSNTLTCNVSHRLEDEPHVEYKWAKAGRVLLDRSRSILVSGGTHGNTDNYTCTATLTKHGKCYLYCLIY